MKSKRKLPIKRSRRRLYRQIRSKRKKNRKARTKRRINKKGGYSQPIDETSKLNINPLDLSSETSAPFGDCLQQALRSINYNQIIQDREDKAEIVSSSRPEWVDRGKIGPHLNELYNIGAIVKQPQKTLDKSGYYVKWNPDDDNTYHGSFSTIITEEPGLHCKSKEMLREVIELIFIQIPLGHAKMCIILSDYDWPSHDYMWHWVNLYRMGDGTLALVDPKWRKYATNSKILRADITEGAKEITWNSWGYENFWGKKKAQHMQYYWRNAGLEAQDQFTRRVGEGAFGIEAPRGSPVGVSIPEPTEPLFGLTAADEGNPLAPRRRHRKIQIPKDFGITLDTLNDITEDTVYQLYMKKINNKLSESQLRDLSEIKIKLNDRGVCGNLDGSETLGDIKSPH